MDYETISAKDLGHSLSGFSLNLLCLDVLREVAFLTDVLGLQAHQVSSDFAIVLHRGQPLQLHSDRTFSRHPLFGVLPESGPRGAGAGIYLPGIDPDAAAARATGYPEVLVLEAATDKAGHAMREAVILSPEGYAWIPSVPMAST